VWVATGVGVSTFGRLLLVSSSLARVSVCMLKNIDCLFVMQLRSKQWSSDVQDRTAGMKH